MGKTLASKKKKGAAAVAAKNLKTTTAKRPRKEGELGEGYITEESIRKMGHRGGILAFRKVKGDNFFKAYRKLLVVGEVRRYCRHIPTIVDYHRRTTVQKRDADYVIQLLDGERVYGVQAKNVSPAKKLPATR